MMAISARTLTTAMEKETAQETLCQRLRAAMMEMSVPRMICAMAQGIAKEQTLGIRRCYVTMGTTVLHQIGASAAESVKALFTVV
jgi:hypothetical protein